MRRAFDIDVLACPRCGGRLRLIATVMFPQIQKVKLRDEALRRLGAGQAASR